MSIILLTVMFKRERSCTPFFFVAYERACQIELFLVQIKFLFSLAKTETPPDDTEFEHKYERKYEHD